MKLMWFSTAPYVGVGYGVSTKDLVPKMVADGHEVTVATKHPLHANFTVDGIDVIDGCDVDVVNNKINKEGYDYFISYMDVWPLEHSYSKWVAVNLLDTEYIHPKMIKNLNKTIVQTAVTKHGYNELVRVGYKPYYTPLGVDTETFKPDFEARKRFREKHGWDDNTFVVGLVGVNYTTDRKNIINLIRAFQYFHKKHPNTVLYLHTDISGTSSKGQPLAWIAASCGFPIDGSGAVQWVDQQDFRSYKIDTQGMVDTYNGMDIMCLPSKGEGFGMPWTEAQSCGTPIISADTTSGRELNWGGWVIPRTDDDFEFSTLLTYHVVIRPDKITHYLNKAYDCWEKGDFKSKQKKARSGALKYDWKVVYEKYWRPFLKVLETRQFKLDVVRDAPNYKEYYNKRTGRLFYGKVDCGKLCGKECTTCFPILPGEKESDMIDVLRGETQPRSVFSRLYPIVPSPEGKLLVSTDCPAHKYLSPRFKKECKEVIEDLFNYPKIRDVIRQWWEFGHFKENYVDLESVKPEFDENYNRFMQTAYETTFDIRKIFPAIEKDSTILDVGCGNGKRVEILRVYGYNAIGCEINKSRVDNDLIVFGDIRNLPFEDDSFDVVVSIDVLEHSSDPLKALSELRRVAKKKFIVDITPKEDPMLYEDPTHVVMWPLSRWIREIKEFGTITRLVNDNTFVVEK